MSRLKILNINPFYLPYNGGIEKRIAAISDRLSGRHSMYVLTSRLPDTPERENLHGATVIRLPSRFVGRYNPPYVNSSGIDEAISEIDPDIIDYHYRWSGTYNRAFFSSERPRVMTFHNLYGEGTGLFRLLSILNDVSFVRKLRKINHVLPVSDFVRNQLTGKGLSGSMMTTSYNGIDIHSCRTRDERFALFVGRLVPTKGLIYLLEAARIAGIPVKIAGDGPMLSTVRKHAVDGKVEVLGKVSEEEKERLLSSCTYMVLPSVQEAFGLVVLEAMVHSKPVIATDSGGLPEVVGDAGTIVPKKDAGALAGAMKSYWENDSLVAEKGELARKRAEVFSWDRAIGKIESVYNSVVASAA